jgi:hypothetical protein
MPLISIFPIDVKLGDAGIPVECFNLEVRKDELIGRVKERIAQKISLGPSSFLDPAFMLMLDSEKQES